MAKVLVVPDVHGSHEWEVVKTYPKDSYDYIVFLGDYFDSYKNLWDDQGENFLNICMFVAEDPEHRKLLLGNHDQSYISKTEDGRNVSGHQDTKHFIIRNLILENIDLIDLAFEVDGVVFSHAGFSKTWVKDTTEILCTELGTYKGKAPEKCDDWEAYQIRLAEFHKSFEPYDFKFSVDAINKVFKENRTKYMKKFEEQLDWCGCFSGSGEEECQGPLWIRPQSLLKDAYYPRQVVGHTEYAFFDFEYLHSKDSEVVLCDSPTHKVFGIIDTENFKEPITIADLYKKLKVFEKSILDFKSVQYATLDYSKETIMPKIIEKFGKDKADFIYNFYFKE